MPRGFGTRTQQQEKLALDLSLDKDKEAPPLVTETMDEAHSDEDSCCAHQGEICLYRAPGQPFIAGTGFELSSRTS